MTLTSDLVLIAVMSGTYLLYYFGVWKHLEMVECHVPFTGHCDFDL